MKIFQEYLTKSYLMKSQHLIFLMVTCVGLLLSCSRYELPDEELANGELKNASVGTVFTVEPGGEDDTQALNQAFLDAISAGPGSIVRLCEGEYHINFIEVREFYGKFLGAGKGKTVILPVADLGVDALLSQNLNTILLRFVGGVVHIAEMTLKTNPGPLSTGSKKAIDGLVGISSVTARYASENNFIDANIDQVEFIGDKNNTFHGLKAESGLRIYPKPLSSYNITITNCTFDGFAWYGALLMELKQGSITIGGNLFLNNGNVGLGVWHNTSMKASIEGNVFNVIEWAGIELYSAPYPGSLEQAPQTFRSAVNIEHNVFNTENCQAAMIINDNRRRYYPDEMPMLVQVKSNRINAEEYTVSGIRCLNMYGMVIRNNIFSGTGTDGVNIRRQFSMVNENGLMLGNNFSNSSYTNAVVHLNPGSHNWTIVGGDLGELVWDQGENNIIQGYNHQSSDIPLGQLLSESLKEMREGVKPVDE